MPQSQSAAASRGPCRSTAAPRPPSEAAPASACVRPPCARHSNSPTAPRPRIHRLAHQRPDHVPDVPVIRPRQLDQPRVHLWRHPQMHILRQLSLTAALHFHILTPSGVSVKRFAFRASPIPSCPLLPFFSSLLCASSLLLLHLVLSFDLFRTIRLWWAGGHNCALSRRSGKKPTQAFQGIREDLPRNGAGELFPLGGSEYLCIAGPLRHTGHWAVTTLLKASCRFHDPPCPCRGKAPLSSSSASSRT